MRLGTFDDWRFRYKYIIVLLLLLFLELFLYLYRMQTNKKIFKNVGIDHLFLTYYT